MGNDVFGLIYTGESSMQLRDLTYSRSVAAVPFAGRYRCIDFIMSNLVNTGISNVGIIAQKNYHSLMDHLGSGKSWDLSRNHGGLTLLPAFAYNEKRGAGGQYRGKVEALAGVMNYLKGIRQDYVLLSDSDLVINLPLEDVLRRHIDSGADMTAVCTTVPGDVSDTYFTVNDTGRITDTVYDVFAPMGCRCLNMFVLSKELLLQMVTECASRNQFSFRRNILREMGKCYHFHAYVYDGYAARINSVQSYYQRSMELLDPALRQALFCPERPVYGKENDSPSSYIDPSGPCVNSLIADGCDIQGSVKNCILFRNVRIEKGASVENCILFKDTVVKSGAVLRSVITDKHVTVSDNVTLMGHEHYPIVIAKGSTV